MPFSQAQKDELNAKLDVVAGEINSLTDTLIAGINDIEAALDEVDELVAALVVDTEEPPPPPGPYVPQNVTVQATVQGQLQVDWDIPGASSATVVSWGNASGFVGSATVQAPTSAHTITGLLPSTQYTVDVLSRQEDGTYDQAHRVRNTATTLAAPVEPPPSAYPRGGSITARRDWIVSKAGLSNAGALVRVGPNNVPQGCQWIADNNATMPGTWPMLYVWPEAGGLLENLDIPARIVPRGTGVDITLRNVKFYDSHTWETGRIKNVERCHSTGPPAGVVAARGWGQANLNALRAGWTARGSIFEGMADNVQQSGGGLLEECILRGLVIFGPAGSGSHNDHTQNYGGLITMRRTLVEQNITAAQESHLNSVFCDGGDYVLEDSLVLISAPAGSNTWALHASKGSNSIRVRHTSVRGKTIGNIILEAGADVSSPY